NTAVRFASTVEEISHAPAEPMAQSTSPFSPGEDSIAEVMSDQIKELSTSLQNVDLQGRRLSRFAFEPYSLPASRINSREDISASSTRLPTPSRGSPHLGPSQNVHTPPLTPAGTDAVDRDGKPIPHRPSLTKGHATPEPITPQVSVSHDATTSSPRGAASDAGPKVAFEDGVDDSHRSHRKGMFSIGPGGSTPVSRESSPSRASQLYSKPRTPQGDANDPYAASKRQPQLKHPDKHNVESRFQFSRRRPGQGTSPSSSTASLVKPDKRHLFGGRRHHSDDGQQDDSASINSRQGSFADLKRFFNKTGNKKEKKEKRPSSQSGADSALHTPVVSHSAATPGQPRHPFGEDHGLISKYGKLGKVLGSGAGGKVRLMKRHDDGVVFAVKEFRERYSYETPKEYVKRLTAEFCVGSTLHHGNVIETLDILQEKERWYQVMEYAPYDLFAIVMTGKMTRPEITCCFLQILNGVTYLHSMGLAHRDLKLDNVVVSDRGIMKIIDFGSSHVFKYPFETNTMLATGIVGSDPYLAPEVMVERKYDAQAVDIWSLAIIFCCMSLRRFPWKVPKMTDNSFKLFAADPTPGHDPKKLALPSKSTNDLSTARARDMYTEDDGKEKKHGEHGHHHHHHEEGSKSRPVSQVEPVPISEKEGEEKKPEEKKKEAAPAADKKEVIRGPWRVLRVLPRESRHIIGRMLEIKVADRAKMEEILQDPWVANSDICSQEGPGGQVTNAEGHTHILEFPQPPAGENK
ncbi:nitrogen permease reactivator protein, partial [Plectosphaerella cucumerina]